MAQSEKSSMPPVPGMVDGAVTDPQPPTAPLAEGLPVARPEPSPSVRDGRYLGENGLWWLDLRVDLTDCRAISVDLHTVGPPARQVSGHTDPRTFDPSARTWPMVWDREGTGEGVGSLDVQPHPSVPDRLEVQLHIREPGMEGGLHPVEVEVRATLDRVADELRTLGIEIEIERGVKPPDPIVDGSSELDLAACMRRALIGIRSAGSSTTIEPPDGRWHGVDILAQLNQAMTRAAQTSLGAPAFEARLLYLSRSDRRGLCGLMFDIEGLLPRQGAAVFVDEIRDRVGDPAEQDRRILQTTVHELGHVLNLTHRFSSGFWGSLSFMNYPDCYRGGGWSQKYQKRFDWNFDVDERRFLRHGFRCDVIPGGNPFGSDAYWLEAQAQEETLDENRGPWLAPVVHQLARPGADGFRRPAGRRAVVLRRLPDERQRAADRRPETRARPQGRSPLGARRSARRDISSAGATVHAPLLRLRQRRWSAAVAVAPGERSIAARQRQPHRRSAGGTLRTAGQVPGYPGARSAARSRVRPGTATSRHQ